MRIILFLIQKEFLQIFRNKSMLPLIFVVPIVQLIILVNAANFEMKNIKLSFVDFDNSSLSRQLENKFSSTNYFKIVNKYYSVKQAINDLDNDKVSTVIVVPKDFEKKIQNNDNNISIQVLTDAINGTNAGITQAYIYSVMQSFNNKIVFKFYSIDLSNLGINLSKRFWYNPNLNYKTFMVPGILVLLVTIISFILSGMNVVREKELGTIEQINVTPIKKFQFIIGKLLPIWVIGMFELAFGLTIGKLLFDIPIVGNIALVFAFAGVYMIVLLSMGLLVSTIVNTQQQSMFVSFFFMVIFILMSGLFTSIDSMPLWAQYFDKINPLSYFIEVMRMILLKGSEFKDIYIQFFSILLFSIIMLLISVNRYRKYS